MNECSKSGGFADGLSAACGKAIGRKPRGCR